MFDPCWGDCAKPVGAREELESAGVPADVIDYALRQHAHELAEKIRAEMSPESYAYTGGWEDAADLIDPEVSSNG